MSSDAIIKQRVSCRHVTYEHKNYSLCEIAGSERFRFWRGFDQQSLILSEEDIRAAAELLVALRKRKP